ncbi:hypothetical protein C8J57DRAFT_1548662 [Mycena rebaudengoi]|nr:hypothetical protein C8J57DRAFT_1548662 [Mycena rebaudengoi]
MSTPPQVVIDDASICDSSASRSCFTFTGRQWAVQSDNPDTFLRTTHFGSGNFDNFVYSVTFTGTAIEIFGQIHCEAPPCEFYFSLDGEPPTRGSNEETFRSIFRLGAEKIGSTPSTHTFRISNTTSSLVVDYALVDEPLNTPLEGKGNLWANINNTAVVYHGAWNKFYNTEKTGESMQSMSPSGK